MLFGHARLVTSTPEKLYAMELITNAIVPARWANTRVPPNAAEMQSTAILRVRIAAGSAKVRSGMPHDERADVDDAALAARVWTGIVPAYRTFGKPVAGPYNMVDHVPAYLDGYIRWANADGKQVAEEAIKEDTPPKKRGDQDDVD